MHACPNCNGNLKFDIASQMLLCEYCDAKLEPSAVSEYASAEMIDGMEQVKDEYEITVFTCSQCGGELLSDSSTVATFCSFCGSSAIMESRIRREKKPQYIIPFRKTKEDCVSIYRKFLKHAFYAPKEIRSEEQISRFRSIYMPYWVYTIKKDGLAVFEAKKTEDKGRTQVVYTYRMKAKMHSRYRGLAYDAASDFSDRFSRAIAPYDWAEAKPFYPSYLCGFYADTKDVDAEVYEQEAKEIAQVDMCNQLASHPYCKDLDLDFDMPRHLEPIQVEKELAMLPVWFLAYRNKDRVSHVVINGQTGEATGEIPVDKKRYLLASFLMAIPIFLLMTLCLRIDRGGLTALTMVLAFICCILSLRQKKKLMIREDYIDDVGSGRYRVFGGKEMRNYIQKENTKDGTRYVKVVQNLQTNMKLDIVDIVKTIAKPVMGVLLAVAVLLISDNHMLLYYIVSALAIVMIGWNLLDLLDRYNRLASRPLPQLGHRGGDENGR